MWSIRFLAVVALSTATVTLPRASAQDAPDALRYELDVKVRDGDLAVTEAIRLSARAPARLALQLVPEMKVLAAESGGRPVPFDVRKGGIELDLSAVNASDAELVVTLRLEGSPREQFPASRGGFLRSAVGPDVVYVRSQVPWYARIEGDPATYRTIIDVRSGWLVRTAGNASPPVRSGDRQVIAFESSTPERAVGLVAGPWVARELSAAGGTVFDAFHLAGKEKGADALLAAARRAFDFYGAWFGKSPLSRFTLVELPETFGASSGYGESGYDLLGPGAFASPPGPGSVALVAHEVAHAWWGHTVSFREWPSEALASFATTRFLEADQGAEAARAERRSSVEDVVRAAEAGKEIAFADIRGFGGGIDAETYASHAYGKAMMLLVMFEQSLGEAPTRKLLARFLDENRGRTVGWTELRTALAGASAAARALVEQWETTGIPRLSIDLTSPGAGKSGRVSGTLRQSGTARPFRMKVIIAAKCGERLVPAVVALDDAESSFDFAVPSEPSVVIIDPDWLLLAARPATAGGADPAKLLEEAMTVANNPTQDDPKLLAKAISQLRTVIETGSPDAAGTCHVGIGRCLFNLGKLDEARKELEEGLRIGAGPFHRGWANLRLGNIADLQKRRKDAVKYYETVLAGPSAKNLEFTKEKARRFLDSAYRGLKQDG